MYKTHLITERCLSSRMSNWDLASGDGEIHQSKTTSRLREQKDHILFKPHSHSYTQLPLKATRFTLWVCLAYRFNHDNQPLESFTFRRLSAVCYALWENQSLRYTTFDLSTTHSYCLELQLKHASRQTQFVYVHLAYSTRVQIILSRLTMFLSLL